ncbi:MULTISPECIES: hypothetical protein [Paraburkholderia]|uniref:Uncharacterized protein n=1 Tax=Paraburkholderia madseniana TaxID=2599607 RepID=A0A6N6W074_9BURK|nr:MULTISPECIES: hypothetical protein [Paraburkholderia]KAE8753796.1 hypothetical protein FSO04_43200 [Paraburkholderia madseniana]MCX4171794.1 hypothetical protein [Paraburkholderia madseniana]MDQ6459803.1 hypothetical protein [Paraburkholderia madseniana]NPT65693.1 hypothetical protein [Paraburkholderia madseniana]
MLWRNHAHLPFDILTRWLHNHTPLEIQTRLHQHGKQMVLLPMNVG